MKTKISLVILLLFTCACSVSRKQGTSPTKEIDQVKKPVFFVSVPITKFSSIQCPCVDVDIDGATFTMELDLGFRGDLSITQNCIDQISSKTFICIKPMYGIRGKQYPKNLYRIPIIRIGAMSFIQPVLQEDTLEFLQDSVFVQHGGKPSLKEPGRLGWELFYNVNLLVDIKNSKIAFCDSLDTLNKQGYATETFIKTPLLLEEGLVELEAKTPEGVLRCLLDTGATLNMLNSEAAEGQSIEQAIWEPENILEYSSFQIDGTNFGPIAFHRVPIKTPVRIEAILGMEFFQDHLVFLDFIRKTMYVQKAE